MNFFHNTFSTNSSNACLTPTFVFAEHSTNNVDNLRAKLAPSSYETTRDDSYFDYLESDFSTASTNINTLSTLLPTIIFTTSGLEQ